jgi:hypothetical protein
MDGLIVSEVCSCIWCPSDLRNDGGIKVKDDNLNGRWQTNFFFLPKNITLNE